MSNLAHDHSHGGADAHAAHAVNDAHDAHLAADDEPDAVEGPKTPGWLTALGGALFLAGAIVWLAASPPEPTLSELTASAAPSASAAAPEASAQPAPPAPAPTPALMPAPAASASAKVLVKGAPKAPVKAKK